MMESVSLIDDKVVMIVTDEVEKVGRTKVRKVIQFLFAEVCYRKAFDKFHCEGCDKDWPSQRDHECCLKSPYEIFDEYYDDAKSRVNLDAVENLCKVFCKLPNIPMTPEWNTFVEALPNQSSHTVYSFWEEMKDSCDHLDIVIVDFVDMLCNNMYNENTWSTDIHLTFESCMNK